MNSLAHDRRRPVAGPSSLAAACASSDSRVISPRSRTHPKLMALVVKHLAIAIVLALCSGRTSAQDASPATPTTDDGWPDLSEFLDEKFGFLPIAVPITEPAVGYGVAGGLAFLSRPLGDAKAGFGRPDITMVGGLATENGSRALAAGDIRYWLDERLQTRVFVFNGSMNLDFHGLGEDESLAGQPLRYELEPLASSLDVRYRLGDTPWWAGLNYSIASIDVSFDASTGTTGLPEFSRESQLGGLVPSITHDSRDNLFTPTSGNYFEATLGLFSEALGGDEEFQRLYLLGMQYAPLAPQLWLGLRGDAAASFGDVPFYLRPFVSLRGVPMLRYQGEAAASLEAELRWQCWQRISLIGFGGVGAAWNEVDRFSNTATASSGGVGVRYELAREYGLHAGFDIAFGPEETVLYVQFGSAWARP